MAADLLPLGAGDGIAGAAADYPHLKVRRSQQGQPTVDLVAVFGLPHLHLALAVQPVGVHAGKARGHMLNNQHPGDVGGQTLEYLQRGLRASRRSPQADNHLVQRGLCPQQGRVGNGHWHRRCPAHLCPRGRNDLLGQCGDKDLVLARLRLAHEVHRTGGQGVEYPQVQGGHQDHRQRILGQQLLEKLHSVHARHLDVGSDDVRLDLRHLGQGVHSVERRAHDLDPGTLGQPLCNHRPGQNGVIHHQNANCFIHGPHRGRLSFIILL